MDMNNSIVDRHGGKNEDNIYLFPLRKVQSSHYEL